MQRILGLIGVVATLALATTGAAQVQERAFQIGISGGPSTPVGDFADEVDTGYHVQGSFDLSLPVRAMTLRADALWQEFALMRGAIGNVRQLGLLGSVLLGVPSPIIRPYVLAGGALTNTSFPEVVSDDAQAGENEAAITGQVGFGVRGGLLGLIGVIEVRMLGLGDHRSIPVSIGIMF